MAPKAKKAAGPVLTKNGEVAAQLMLAESRASNMLDTCIGVVNKCVHDALYTLYTCHVQWYDAVRNDMDELWWNLAWYYRIPSCSNVRTRQDFSRQHWFFVDKVWKFAIAADNCLALDLSLRGTTDNIKCVITHTSHQKCEEQQVRLPKP